MKYTLLIYEAPVDFSARNDAKKRDAYWGGWSSYTKALQAAGVMIGGAGLQAPETATTLKIRDGQRLVQDGPFADTKEQFGGYYLIDVPDLDSALDWAARCPSALNGMVEVRPNLQPKG